MEPCAPGTEDDPPIMYSTLNKQANENERLLKQKAILKNGQYDNVFELSYVNGAEHWFCNACQCPVMGRVYQHEIGKRHSQNLSKTNRHIEVSHKEEVEDDSMVIDIAPGEPVPPGFEEEIGRVSQIQERLDNFNVGPLIALEYLLELQDYDATKEPVYLCILCDKRGDPRTVLTHLASYNHISQYLQKHFPTCYRALAPYMTKQYKRNWQTTLQKIAEAIEKKFGRLKPYPIEKHKFEKERLRYLQMISKGKHFSEISGWTFEELIVHDELTKVYEDDKGSEIPSVTWGGSAFIQKPFKKRSPSPPVVACPSKRTRGNAQTNPKKQLSGSIQTGQSTNPSKSNIPGRRRSLSSVSSVSSNDLSDGEGRKNKNAPLKSVRSPRGRQLPYQRHRSPSPRRKSPPRRGDRQMPWQNPNYQKQKNEFAEKVMTGKERDRIRKIEEFRKLARAIENDMHKTLKQHEKNPEKHPQYNDEWKKFWNKRYKELQAQGVDASKHDFKPEWIEFWNKRMVELHSDELRSKKDALRKRLGLPEEPTPIKFKIGVQHAKNSPKDNKPNLPMAAQPDIDNEVIVIDDKEDDRRSMNRSHSPWEDIPKSRSRRVQSPSPGRSHKKSPVSRRARSPSSGRSHKRSPVANPKSRERSPKIERGSSKSDRAPRRSKSRERTSLRRTKSRERSHSREISRSKDYKRSHSRERRSRSQERSWERREMEKRMEYRESSYERDLRGRERIRTVADLPWEREKAYRQQFEDYYKPPHIMRNATRKPVIMPEVPGLPLVPPEDDDDTEVNIVDVLRILTALEERLGSLGPRVNDLLAQALALEKKEANSSETLLDNDLNCVLFETVKEKLKGQLLAGLVDIIQERAFKKAIKKTATLIHMAGQRNRQKDRLLPKLKPVTVPGVGTVDKSAIAKQIATALIMQGKTDVTQAELEQLINAVVGMAEAAKGSDKPMTTANFLQQLAEGSVSLGSLEKQKEKKEPEEKIIIPTSCKKPKVVELEKLTEPLTPSPGKSSVTMENLSDSDLQTLLQNFKDLSTDEQHNLINYLKKLENHEPERVERLRKFVNLDPNTKTKEENDTPKDKPAGHESPFSNRASSVNPTLDDVQQIESEEEDMKEEIKETKTEEKEKPPGKLPLDSEEEDYTYEDVVKAVSKTVKDKELKDNMKIIEESIEFGTNKTKNQLDLSNAKALISNLMSNFSKSSSNSNTIDLLGLGVSSANTTSSTSSMLTTSADFAKTFDSINIANLASIVSNVKKLSPSETPEKRLNFEPPSPVRSNAGKLNLDPSFSPNFMNNESSQSFDNFRENVPMGRPAMGFSGPNRPESVGPRSMASGGPSMGSGLNYGGQGGFNRDNRGFIPPGRDMGSSGPGMGPFPSNLGPRDRPAPQFSRNSSYGSNYGPNYPQEDDMQYLNSRGMRPNTLDQRNRVDVNPRYGSNLGSQYNNGHGNGNYNRW